MIKCDDFCEMIPTRLDTPRWPRRPTPKIGDVPAGQVLASRFGPLVPRRFGALVAVAVDDAGVCVWSEGRHGTLPPLGDPSDHRGGRGSTGHGKRGTEAVFQIASVTKV
nr:hypothetical protein [Micromonospora sp. DSM 115978]